MTIRHRGRTLSMSNQIILNNRNCYTRGTYILLSTSIDQTKLQNIIRFRTEIWRHISNQNRTLIIVFLHTGFNDLFLYFEKQLNIVFCYDTWWLAILRFRDCGYYELFDSAKWSQVAVKKNLSLLLPYFQDLPIIFQVMFPHLHPKPSYPFSY